MSYRPICDIWILARPKVKYYGAYPGGFLERARALIGVNINDPVLHVCAGMVDKYPYKGGYGPNDKRLDLDPALQPDYLQDAREPFPAFERRTSDRHWPNEAEMVAIRDDKGWPAILIDRPYTEADADHYAPGRTVLPPLNLLLKNGLEAVRVGGRVGLLDYRVPQPPRSMDVKFIALVGVSCGFNNNIRAYSVFERRA
jgi:hypothetical protein